MKMSSCVVVCAATPVAAQSFSVVTNETQWVTMDGPSSSEQHYAEGDLNAERFRSFAASDYDLSGVSGFNAGYDLDTLQFDIQQSLRFFSVDGDVNFYVASASNDMSELGYAGDDVLANPGGLIDVAFVGSSQFVQQSTGFQDSFSFDFDGALDDSDAERLIEAALVNGDELRWVISAEDATIATWGGIGDTNTTIDPTISGTFSIPAPSTAVLFAFGVAAVRRRG